MSKKETKSMDFSNFWAAYLNDSIPEENLENRKENPTTYKTEMVLKHPQG